MVAVTQPRRRQVSTAVRAGWWAVSQAALDLANAGKFAESRASAERLLATIEGVLGVEAEELLGPLDVLSFATRRAGHLDDSYTIMLRTLNISEKHHGEEGMVTCHLRTKIGAFTALFFFFSSPLSPCFLPSFSGPFQARRLVCVFWGSFFFPSCFHLRSLDNAGPPFTSFFSDVN